MSDSVMNAADSPAAPSPPALWAVAGGKGGAGRTLLAANMGIQIARLGRKVAVADLDLQGPGLHTCLGFGHAPRTVEGLLDTGGDDLPGLLLDTSVSGLKLLAGVRRSLDPSRRALLLERFLAACGSLPVDIVLLDCGSGRSPETLDLFRAARCGILVTTPEPAAFESLYLFVETLLRRVMETRLSSEDGARLSAALGRSEEAPGHHASFRTAVEGLRREDAGLCGRILEALRPLRLRLILNQVRGDTDAEIPGLLRAGFDKFFGLALHPAGSVEYDLSVLQSVQKRKPLAQQYPNSPAMQGIERAVSALLSAAREADGALPLERDLSALDHYRLLDVAPAAPSKEIQQSYDLLKRAFDPDYPFRHPGLSPAQVERIGAVVENAYRTLIFLETRSEYDRKLVEEGVLLPEQAHRAEQETALAVHPAASGSGVTDTVASLPVSGRDAPAKAPAAGEQAAGAPAAVPGRGIPVTGTTLREHREGRNLSLEAIGERTKIRPSILEALEADRFADLPEPVFLRGFLRQLAVCLGLDPAAVSREYMERIHPSGGPRDRRSR